MKKIKRYIKGFILGFFLMFEGLGKAIGQGVASLVDKVISKEQEVPELTTQEKFTYYTGVLGFHQQAARDRGDQETIDAIEDDLWEMAHAYKMGNLEEFLWKKTQTDTIYDFIVEEDGKTKLVIENLNDGSKKEVDTGIDEIVAGKQAHLAKVPD